MKKLPELAAILCSICLLSMLQACRPDAEPGQLNETKATYTGSASCQSCHPQAFADWTQSDHFQAMQPANDSTVLGDFNNSTFTADGVTSSFFKKDGKFYINTQGDDGLNHDYEVLYVFGYFPLQQYLIGFPGGRMQSTRASWDSRDKKWFHQYAGQSIPHWDWLHWTGNAQNWNTMCASCHSTDLQKKYDDGSDSYSTTWSEINVSCESCHGPGSQHIAYVGSKAFQNGKRIENAGLWYGRDTLAQQQLNTCASCHARKTDVTGSWQPSREIMDNLIPQVISTEFYFADGQIREEVYEYGSFTQSKMFAHNVRCSSCHNPHSGKLRLEGNNLCLSCHKAEYATSGHHFHKENTEAALCINCHMVARTFMGNDHRRDHSFRVPRPDQSVSFATPNACNTCHADKTPAWAFEAVKQWYGPQRKYHFSDDLIPGSLLNESSEAHLVHLLADTAQPEIARATAAYYLGQLPSQGSALALLKAMKDEKAHVRYRSVRALENFPPSYWQTDAVDRLKDSVRAVRIAAVDLYHKYPEAQVPAASRTAFETAEAENIAFLRQQTDFAVGNVMLADYYMQAGNYADAIRYYRKGLRKDSLMNYARVNLAVALNVGGRNQEALQTLLDAEAIDPVNDQVAYKLGLLYYEMSDLPSALKYFGRAEHLGSFIPGLYYNFGLALQQQGRLMDAEKKLLKGLKLEPNNPRIHYALAYLYTEMDQPVKAREHVRILKSIDPYNPEYEGLFQHFGL